MIKLNKLMPISLNGNLKRGGYTMTGRVEGDTDAVSKGQNWQLRGRSGADFLDAENRIVFDGHIIAEPDNFSVSRYASTVQIQAGTMDRLISGIDVQDIGFTNVTPNNNDHQITSLSFDKIIDHVIKRHCNAIYDATLAPDGVITSLDIDTTNSMAFARYNVGQSSNMWRVLQNIGGLDQGGEFYIPYFDRTNTFHYQPFPAFWAVKPTTKGTISGDHIKGAIRIKRNANQPGAQVGQVSIMSVADTLGTTYAASFPSDSGDGKLIRKNSGIFAESQAKTLTLATRLYQWMTRAYTLTVEVDPGLILFGDDGNGIDLANMITLDYDGPTLDATTGAGLSLDLSGNYFVFGVQVNFEAQKGFLTLESDPT